MFKLVSGSESFKNKRFGKLTGEKVYFDSFYSGAFDMDDFRNLKDNVVYATFLGHVIGERSYVENYKKLIDEAENER